MKKLKINTFSLFIFLLSVNLTYGQGIKFLELTFDEAKKEAQKKDKLIFIDCYTTWCGPCKQMAATTFMDEKVGEYFNKNFINVKYDMEKGDGVELAKQFAIRAYPTLLLVDSDGKITFRTEGAPSEIEKFIDLFDKGSQPDMNLTQLEKEYEAGEITNERMLNYISFIFNGREFEKAFQLQGVLLGKLTDEEKLSEKYWEIVKSPLANLENPENILFVLNNYDYYKSNHPEKDLNYLLSKTAWLLVNRSSIKNTELVGKHENYIVSYLEQLEKIDLPDKTNIIICFQLVQAFNSKDYSLTLKYLLEINLDNIIVTDANSIINILKEINQTNPEMVKQFVEMRKTSVESIGDITCKMIIGNYFNSF